MGRAIVMFERDGERRYCEWSTIVDAPVSWVVPLSVFEEHIRYEHGEAGMRDLPERLIRVHERGTSALWTDRESLLSNNRAGPKETHLDDEAIWDRYAEGGKYWKSCEERQR